MKMIVFVNNIEAQCEPGKNPGARALLNGY